MTTELSRTGRVLEIIRMSTEDGPGLRTTIFLKGCPLHCAWCHNPESIAPAFEMQWIASRCIGCASCVAACPETALALTPQGVTRDGARCIACGRCADACPTTAMERIGADWNASDLVAEVLKDRAYFARSDRGGVTLSGGEASLQADFAEDLLRMFSTANVHTALDTCGYCRADTLERLLPWCDLVLFDLKDHDETRHRAHTGVGLATIHERLVQLREAVLTAGKPREVWVRTPLIPGATATTDCVRGIGRDVARLAGDVVARWELCAFNNLCGDKYTRLGRAWSFAQTPLLTERELADLVNAARESGVNPDCVIGTGATREATPAGKDTP